MKNKRLWVTWENQRRNKTLSKALSAELLQIEIKKNRTFRYMESIIKTIRAYLFISPEIIFVQNPSIVLSILSVTYGKIMKIPVVVDAHNSGIFPLEWWSKKTLLYRVIADLLTKSIIRWASLTIVTNENLAIKIFEMGGKAFVLPDPLPEFTIQNNDLALNLKGRNNLFFICTFAKDEPYEAVIEAGRYIRDDIFIYISGDSKKIFSDIYSKIPKNIILTGFLPEDKFVNMIFASDAIIVLTNADDCLVCGGYEAVAAGKPAILSDKLKLKEYFGECALYTDNSVKDLTEKINKIISNREIMVEKVSERREILKKEWKVMKENLEEKLSNLTDRP